MAGRRKTDLRTWDENGRMLTRRDGSPCTGRAPSQGDKSGIPASPGHGPAKGTDMWKAPEITHGAHTPRVVEPRAALLARDLLAERPDLARYPQAVKAWATAEARCQLVREYEASQPGGLLDGDGNPRSFSSLATSLEKTAAAARDRLGLDPLSEARLMKERAATTAAGVNLAQLAAEGRSVLASRPELAELLAGATDDDQGHDDRPDHDEEGQR